MLQVRGVVENAAQRAVVQNTDKGVRVIGENAGVGDEGRYHVAAKPRKGGVDGGEDLEGGGVPCTCNGGYRAGMSSARWMGAHARDWRHVLGAEADLLMAMYVCWSRARSIAADLFSVVHIERWIGL